MQMSNINDWGGGRFEGHFQFPVQGEDLQGWEAVLTCSAPVNGLTVGLVFIGVFLITRVLRIVGRLSVRKPV